MDLKKHEKLKYSRRQVHQIKVAAVKLAVQLMFTGSGRTSSSSDANSISLCSADLILDDVQTKESTDQKVKQEMIQKKLLNDHVRQYVITFLFVNNYRSLQMLEKLPFIEKWTGETKQLQILKKI